MAELEAWPIVFVVWNSKADEGLAQFRQGRVEAFWGKLHGRKGASFLAVTEVGQILAKGSLEATRGREAEVSLTYVVSAVNDAPRLTQELEDRLRRVPRPFLRGPVSALIIIPDADDSCLDTAWFTQASAMADTGSVPPVAPAPKAESTGSSRTTSQEESKPSQRETLLADWLPPALFPLLSDHVRADEWEVVVACAFRALGFRVEVLGKEKARQAVPDCVARYATPAGQLFELVVDAKAGRWTAAVDDLRAMRDYIADAPPYSYPVFVANSLGPGIDQKLRDIPIGLKLARAVTGRDLAGLIVQRFTNPEFHIELELRRLFL